MSDLDIDSHKLMYHPQRVSEWIEKGDCAPIYVEVGLTNICNHNCFYCGLDWARGKNTLDTKTLLETLEDMANYGIKSVCFSGAGEPLLHKDFSLFVKKTKEYGVDVSFSTNTVLFNEGIAEKTLPYTSWIRFSVDAATSETHAKIHGTSEKDFPKILKNLSNTVEIKRKNNYETTLGIQFMLLEENSHEVLNFAEICKNIGVDNLQIKPYSQNPNSINKMNIDYEKFRDLEEKLKSFSTDNFEIIYRAKRMKRIANERDYDICYGLPFFSVINEKGNVEPCIFHYDKPEFSYGNIYDNLFSKIWKNKKRQDILKKLHQRGTHDCKKGCRLDVINRYLYRLKNPQPHDNFV